MKDEIKRCKVSIIDGDQEFADLVKLILTRKYDDEVKIACSV